MMQIKTSYQIGLLAPKQDNPRNSEGAFITLDDGKIAFAYSRYHGDSAHDNAHCDICVIYSYNNGESFDVENFETLVRATEYSEKNIMSVSLMRMQNGDIGLFYLLKHKGLTNEYILRRYDGMLQKKLSEVKCLPDKFPAYYVVNNDRVIRHSSGRLIIPAAFHSSSVLPDMQEIMHGRSKTVFFISDDDGFHWQMHSAELTLNDPYSKSGLQEPGLVELPNGTLYCYMRTDRMYQFESFSVDGDRWTTAQPSKFSSPDSPMLIKREPISGDYFAVWNPAPVYPTRPRTKIWTGGRNPLVIASSKDGLNFSEPIILEDDQTRGFCYPSIHFIDDKIMLLAYCSGGTDDRSCLNRITLRRLELE